LFDMYDPTSIWMGGQCHNLIIKCGNDELDSILWNAFDALLAFMILILISNTAHNMTIKLCDHFSLLIQINHLYGLKIQRNVKPLPFSNYNYMIATSL
uniref:Uncharacterized protein n=1 Tax=Solanum lycopersicum TaxID=4081 RepID=A0A3Q7GM45_SOLLC